MNIHTLEKEKNQDFLEQERIDPITGDILQEGDQIVICASCKSAFLTDSWSYMDAKHCNQTHTLREIPKREAVKIDRESRNERLDKLAFYQFRTVEKSEVTGIYTGFFALVGGILCYSTYLFSMDVVVFSFTPVLIGMAIGKSIYKQKTLLLDSGHFVINQNEKNQVFIDKENIKTIRSKKAKFFSRLANSILFNKGEEFYDLIITTKTGEVHKVFISEHEVKRIEQETNILKKYAVFENNQIPTPDVPFINPPPPNDRLDLGSPS
jgi:hypothetical protein